MRSLRALPFVVMIGVSACAAQLPRTASQDAFALQSTFVGLLKAENHYAELPRCSPAQHAPCSDQNVVNAMSDRSDQAQIAVDQAVGAARDTAKSENDRAKANIAAQRAVDALRQIIDASQAKKV